MQAFQERIALAGSAVYKAFSNWSPEPARIVIAVLTCLVAAVFLLLGLVMAFDWLSGRRPT